MWQVRLMCFRDTDNSLLIYESQDMEMAFKYASSIQKDIPKLNCILSVNELEESV